MRTRRLLPALNLALVAGALWSLGSLGCESKGASHKKVTVGGGGATTQSTGDL